MGEPLRCGSPEQSHDSSPRVCTGDSRERSPSQVGYSLCLNFVENLVDGNRLLPVLLQDLNSATRSIHISIFIFFDDPIGEEISSVLEAKARAGATVDRKSTCLNSQSLRHLVCRLLLEKKIKQPMLHCRSELREAPQSAQYGPDDQ